MGCILLTALDSAVMVFLISRISLWRLLEGGVGVLAGVAVLPRIFVVSGCFRKLLYMVQRSLASVGLLPRSFWEALRTDFRVPAI